MTFKRLKYRRKRNNGLILRETLKTGLTRANRRGGWTASGYFEIKHRKIELTEQVAERFGVYRHQTATQLHTEAEEDGWWTHPEVWPTVRK